MKKVLLWLMALFYSVLSFGQVGINTTTPTAMLHIKATGATGTTKALSIINSSNTEVLTVLDNGYMGLGVSNPSIALDLRDGTDRSILGIGNTTATPATVGAGVIKYDASQKLLYVSDATKWLTLSSSIEKATILADINSTPQVFNNATTSSIIDWSVELDYLNSFDASTGVFTAPHDGLYSVSIMLGFNSSIVNNNSFISILLVGSNGVTISGITTYSVGGTADVYARCSGSFSLLRNETLTLQIQNSLGANVTLAGSNFNKLSIIES